MFKDIRIYSQDHRHLIVLPSIPKWFIVDDLGLAVLNEIIKDKPPKSIASAYPPGDRKEILRTCREITEMLNELREQTTPAVTDRALTSRTTVAMISVTRSCNLSTICPHCYVDADGPLGAELTLSEHRELGKQIVKNLASNPKIGYRVNLTGGEPFMHRGILDIVRAYYDDCGLEVSISTNGLLIQERMIQPLCQMGVQLQVSLDGAGPMTHDAIRGPGSFRRVTERIQHCTKAGITVGINFLAHEGNVHDLENTVDLAYRLGCSGFNPINLVQLGRACDSKLKRADEAQIFDRLASYLAVRTDQQALFRKTSMFSSLGAALLAGITCISCGVGNRPCVYVDATGEVYPCANTQKPEFLLGNIRQVPLSECIRSEHPVLCMLKNLKVDSLNSTCSQCDIRKFCGGDCRGETYNVTGNLHAPYVACPDRHDSIIKLMWIAADHPELFMERAEEYTHNALES